MQTEQMKDLVIDALEDLKHRKRIKCASIHDYNNDNATTFRRAGMA